MFPGRILVVILVSALSLLCQIRTGNRFFYTYYNQEKDSSGTLFLEFRIPGKYLYFIKDSCGYSAGININIEELVPEGSERISFSREYNYCTKANAPDESIKNISVEIADAADTSSFRVETGIKNSSDSYFEIIKLTSESNKYYGKPFVIADNSENTITPHFFIPYSPKSYSVIIPQKDTSLTDSRIKIFSGEKLLRQDTLSPVPGLMNGNESFVKSLTGNSYYRIKDITGTADEGLLTIQINSVEDSLKKAVFNLPVVWEDKPFFLYIPELTALAAKRVFGEELNLKNDKDKYYENLKAFLAQYDPDKTTPYNEALIEFASRAEEADRNYSTAGVKHGMLSDRGMIYIRFGRPDNVNREYPQKGNVREVWEYSDLKAKFVFEDKSGLGKFELRKH